MAKTNYTPEEKAALSEDYRNLLAQAEGLEVERDFYRKGCDRLRSRLLAAEQERDELLALVLPYEDEAMPRTMDRARSALRQRADMLHGLKRDNQRNYERAAAAEGEVERWKEEARIVAADRDSWASAAREHPIRALSVRDELTAARLRNQELVAALEEIARWSQELQDRGAHLEQWRGCVAIARAALQPRSEETR